MGWKSIWLFIIVVILTQQGIKIRLIRLDQSPAEIKRPGETVKISSGFSGFTMTDYLMHWIRQKPGKALEWIGRVYTGGSSRSDYLTYADSMKNHFTMSEDVSQSTQYLEAKSLREEDTAVYYCARETQRLHLMKQLYKN
uniref:Immunoglobulin heavy variable 2-2 n=1 Tax=Sinocyclocheilus anshuiensis TaxID=1608454 RepID=A0A671RWI2_9TELE